MKINIIIPFKRLSGGIKVIYQYAEYFYQQGYDVICYLPMISYRGKNDSRLLQLKASISNTLKPEKWFKNHFKIKIVPLINNIFIRNADIIIATSWQTAYDVNKLSNLKGKKIYFVQGYETFNGETNKVENTYKFDMKIVTVSNSLKKRLLKFNKNIEVIYNGIDPDFFNKNIKKSDLIKNITFLYHEEKYKGTEDGLYVAIKLHEQYPDLVFNVFGRKIHKKLPDYFHIYENPSRYELIELYKKTDIYIFTSRIESWGLPIIEAMANKCLVIGRRIGALEEIGNDNNCIIVNDKIEMLQQIKNIIENRIEIKNYQINAFETSKELLWENSYLKFNKIIIEEVNNDKV